MTTKTTLDPTDRRRSRSGSFYLELPPSDAIHLFTAEGECLWVPGWQPQILGPVPQSEGLVFLTQADGQQVVWTVLASDWPSGRVKYCRVIPSRSAGTVEVQIRPDGTGSRVTVRYDVTILPGGEEPPFLTEAGFCEMLEAWSRMIGDAIRLGASSRLRRMRLQAQPIG